MSSGRSVWPAAASACSRSATVIVAPAAFARRSRRTPGPRNHSSGSWSIVRAGRPRGRRAVVPRARPRACRDGSPSASTPRPCPTPPGKSRLRTRFPVTSPRRMRRTDFPRGARVLGGSEREQRASPGVVVILDLGRQRLPAARRDRDAQIDDPRQVSPSRARRDGRENTGIDVDGAPGPGSDRRGQEAVRHTSSHEETCRCHRRRQAGRSAM